MPVDGPTSHAATQFGLLAVAIGGVLHTVLWVGSRALKWSLDARWFVFALFGAFGMIITGGGTLALVLAPGSLFDGAPIWTWTLGVLGVIAAFGGAVGMLTTWYVDRVRSEAEARNLDRWWRPGARLAALLGIVMLGVSLYLAS